MTNWLTKHRPKQEELPQQAENVEVGQSRVERLLEHQRQAELETAVEETPAEPQSQFKASEYKPGSTYFWVEHDNIWDVARRLGFGAHELMEHNDIADPKDIQPGDGLHLPIAKPTKIERPITYEVLPEPLPFHVSKKGGCKKWAFGNGNHWEDFKSSGFFPEHTNVTIVAIAHVPVEEKDGKEVEAAYYMDTNALGDYAESDRVRYTIGYMWSDLNEGHVEKPVAPPPPPVAQVAIIDQNANQATKDAAKVIDVKAPDQKKLDIDQQIAEEAAAHPERYPNFWKTTYQALRPPVPCITILPKPLEFIWVEDQDGRRPQRKLMQHQEITISGTFEKDDVTYGRPAKSAENFNWYGIPMDMLQSQEDLYNSELDAPTRAANGGRLSWTERLVTVPLSKLVHHPRFRHLQRQENKKTNNKE
jgi:hypothetical protein